VSEVSLRCLTWPHTAKIHTLITLGFRNLADDSLSRTAYADFSEEAANQISFTDPSAIIHGIEFGPTCFYRMCELTRTTRNQISQAFDVQVIGAWRAVSLNVPT
jgi:hypothetical protein